MTFLATQLLGLRAWAFLTANWPWRYHSWGLSARALEKGGHPNIKTKTQVTSKFFQDGVFSIIFPDFQWLKDAAENLPQEIMDVIIVVHDQDSTLSPGGREWRLVKSQGFPGRGG
jgi:hypothetical protein